VETESFGQAVDFSLASRIDRSMIHGLQPVSARPIGDHHLAGVVLHRRGQQERQVVRDSGTPMDEPSASLTGMSNHGARRPMWKSPHNVPAPWPTKRVDVLPYFETCQAITHASD
jgi:hypothetical protein